MKRYRVAALTVLGATSLLSILYLHVIYLDRQILVALGNGKQSRSLGDIETMVNELKEDFIQLGDGLRGFERRMRDHLWYLRGELTTSAQLNRNRSDLYERVLAIDRTVSGNNKSIGELVELVKRGGLSAGGHWRIDDDQLVDTVNVNDPSIPVVKMPTGRYKSYRRIPKLPDRVPIAMPRGAIQRSIPKEYIHGNLQPADTPVVPRIVHYLWVDSRFEHQQFQYVHYLSIVSAHRFVKPNVVMFHSNVQPQGVYWARTKAEVPTLRVKFIQRQTNAPNGVSFSYVEHMTDFLRLLVLRQYGGVYVDCDVIFIRDIDPLLHFDFTVGIGDSKTLSNAFIASTARSAFLQIYARSYLDYNPNCWMCSGMGKLYKLALTNPALLHIEYRTTLDPLWYEWDKLMRGHMANWRETHYCFHIWQRFYFQDIRADVTEFDEQNIGSLNSTAGEIMRLIDGKEAHFHK